MSLTPVTLTDTFDVWRTRTNQIIAVTEETTSNVSNTRNIAVSAFGQANLAFTQANNVGGAVTTANNTAIAAFGQANLAFTQANNVGGAVTTANSNIVAAFGQANTATTIGSSAFGQANTATTIGSSAFGQANLAFNQANTATTIGSSAFNQANSAQTIAIAAFDQANTGGGESANLIVISSLLQDLTLEDTVVTGFELSNNVTELNLIDPALFSITANSTITLAPGESATVTNSGNSRQALFNFGIPRGNVGNTGLAATITIGSTTTGAPETEASVTNSGNSSFATLNFSIPRGNVGNTGPQGNTGPVAPKAITVFEPVANDNWTLFYTNQPIVLSEIRTVITSSGNSPSVNASFFYGTNRTSGTSIQSSVITTSETTGNSVTSFTNGTIPANNFVWLTISTSSNTLTYHASLLT